MGLLEKEITELRQLLRDIQYGKYSDDSSRKDLNAILNVYARIEKRAAMMLQAYAVATKYNNYGIKKLEAANMLGTGSAIDLVDIEADAVACPIKGGEAISRRECLSYSSDHVGECEPCENFGPTRNMILGEQQ